VCSAAIYSLLKDFAGPLATVLAAGAAVFVTFKLGKAQQAVAQQQAKIAQTQATLATVRLQHDLYDRRYKLFEVARSFLAQIARDATIDTESIFKFARETSNAVFLLNNEIVEYFDEMRKRAIRLGFLKTAINLPQYAPQLTRIHRGGRQDCYVVCRSIRGANREVQALSRSR
jgi:hypothetical protein